MLYGKNSIVNMMNDVVLVVFINSPSTIIAANCSLVGTIFVEAYITTKRSKCQWWQGHVSIGLWPPPLIRKRKYLRCFL